MTPPQNIHVNQVVLDMLMALSTAHVDSDEDDELDNPPNDDDHIGTISIADFDDCIIIADEDNDLDHVLAVTD